VGGLVETYAIGDSRLQKTLIDALSCAIPLCTDPYRMKVPKSERSNCAKRTETLRVFS
jgi:hypothetical protein